ncbi:MAG: GGDEF domain-containing protein [Actinobacteria bacterium]|nr:GGDEF domain-containing protein [Actinomycetota bacterium]
MAGPSGRWWFGLAAVVGVLAMLLLVPTEPTQTSLLARIVGIVGCLVFLVAALRLPRQTRNVWLLFWASMTMTVLGDVLYDLELATRSEALSPALSDIPYFASYLFMILGLSLLLRQLLPGRGIETWIDTGIVTIAVSSVIAAYVLGPALIDASAQSLTLVLTVTYPLLDLVLLALFIRILQGLRWTNLALVLLALATGLFLVSDLWYQMQLLRPVDGSAESFEVLWTAALLTYVLAVTAPGAGRPTSRAPSKTFKLSLGLGLFAGIGVLTTPMLLAIAAFADAEWLTRWLALANGLVVLLLLARVTLLLLKVQRQSNALANKAREDALTGLPNRRAWDHDLVQAANLSDKTGAPLTVAILDLDHFKDFNDTFGHQAGDRMLASAARAWEAHLTRGDILARYGGEEFGLILAGTSLAEAREQLDRIRHSTPAGVTVSIGAAEFIDGEPVTKTLRRADQALYRAKDEGRDRVVVAANTFRGR